VGYSAYLVTRSVRQALLLGALLSLGVEFAQLWIPGRYTTFSDLGANSLGALLGAGLSATRRSWWKPTEEAAVKLSWAWASLVTLVIVVSGFLLSPNVPEGDLYASWTPELGGFETYSGRVLQASLGDIELPDGRLDDQASVRSALQDGIHPLVVRFRVGDPPRRRSMLFRILDEEGDEALSIVVSRSEMWLSPGYLARDLRLSSPVFTFPAVPPTNGGRHVELVVSRTLSGASNVSLDGEPRTFTGLTAGRGWSLFYFPRGASAEWLDFLDLVWLALLVAPLGWWAPSTRQAAVLASIPFVAVIASPLWSALSPAHLSGLLSPLVAVAVARLLRSRYALTSRP
jgi:hypothetical protein